ncbi:PH domain-containing protein [Streptomyces sp. NPDC048507]|uniref:PH domain-containing protein n=1 Tax=Streptomyces sp. NPDC048507 TaxID=3365560 RepID=UPI0037124697
MNAEPLPRRYRTKTNRAFTLAWALGIPMGAFLLKVWTESFPYALQLSTTVVCAAGFLLVLWTSPRGFTCADEQGISRRAFLRTERLDWADVYDIRTVAMPASTVGRFGRMQPDQAYAYRADGRRVLLPYLNAQELGEAEFPGEMAVLRSMLADRRADGWMPDPSVEAHIARHEARYGKRVRALTGKASLAIIIFVIMIVIMAPIVGTAVF